jgi:hypothetical protein
LKEELGVIVASFTPIKVVARGGVLKVATETPHVVEEKTTLTLLVVMVIVSVVVIV